MPRRPSRSHQFEELARQLRELTETLQQSVDPNALSPTRARQVRGDIAAVCHKLSKVVEELDPIKHPGMVFDPSNPNVVGRIVGITLIAQPRKPLDRVESFYGSGVYAIYYNGAFSPYGPIARMEHPIYVGKADPNDQSSKTAMEQGDRLSRRLKEHCKNINKATSTLRIEDFEYRALVVQSGWQTAAESYLIDLFKPVWNREMDIAFGLGKHGDSTDTRANLRSPWDTLHPGREWAHRDQGIANARELHRIEDDLRRHFAQYPPLSTVDEILRRFLREMGEG